MKVRALNKRQHEARVRELRRQGCKVDLVERPEGVLVLTKCPRGVKPRKLTEGRDWEMSGLGEPAEPVPWLVAAGAAVAGALVAFAVVRTAHA